MSLNKASEAFARIDALPLRPSGGNYVPFTQVGELVYLSGQTSGREGTLVHQGQVGIDLTVEQAYQAAQLCMENLFAALKQAVHGDWDRVQACVRLTGYVNSVAPFGQGPAVINGASDLVVELMGDAGRHARTAVGVAALPGNAAVEVEAIFKVRV
ncbi:MAG: RidA family protein [Orrella sp.]